MEKYLIVGAYEECNFDSVLIPTVEATYNTVEEAKKDLRKRFNKAKKEVGFNPEMDSELDFDIDSGIENRKCFGEANIYYSDDSRQIWQIIKIEV